jgi:hypothetical protein
MLFASTFTLGPGDLVSIIGAVAVASGVIYSKLAALKSDIERSARRHESRCQNYDPRPRAPALVDLQDIVP